MSLCEVVSMLLKVGSVIRLSIYDLRDFWVLYELRFEGGGCWLELAVILLRLGHEDVFQLLLDVFSEEDPLSVRQKRRFSSLVELPRDDNLLVQCYVRTVVSWTVDFVHRAARTSRRNNESRWDLL
jgi:hypothetical protein